VERFRRFGLPSLLALAFVVLLHGDGRVGLFEPSEARYAEVAREMVASGDYLSPQIDCVYHFTKPPLTYWITAAGYGLFGVNPLGARFFLAVAAVIILYLTARLYRLQFSRSTGVGAAAFLLFSMEFFAMGKVLTTDLYLALWTTAGLFLWALKEKGKVSERLFSALFGAVAALAFLSKGGVCLLFWACVLVPYGLWKDKGRSLRPLASPWCWLTFLIAASPWFVAAGLSHPGLLRFLALHESFDAAYSSQRYHPGPFYYYAVVLAAGIFPWWVVIVARWREAAKPELRLWLLWAVVPILIWSLFAAKLPTYVLPAFPAWALLAAALWLEGEGPQRWVMLLTAALTAAASLGGLWLLASGAWALPSAGDPAVALFGLAGFLAVAGLIPAGWGRPRLCLLFLMGAVLAVQLSVPALCQSMEGTLKIRSRLGQVLVQNRLKEEVVLEYRTTLFSVPFYLRDKVAAFDNGFAKNKYIECVPPYIIEDAGALGAYVRANPRLWIVTDRNAERTLHQAIPGLSLFFREGDHSVWASPPVAERLGAAAKGLAKRKTM